MSARSLTQWLRVELHGTGHRLTRQLRHEWRVLVKDGTTRTGWRRPSCVVAVSVCALIVTASWFQRSYPHAGRVLLGEQASLWWPVALARLPGSMVAPAPRLPLWGALAQVFFFFGLAETHLGRRTTLWVIALTHAVATISARLLIVLGPRTPLHLGIPQWVRWQRDTGPSGAVVGIGTYLGVILRIPLLTSLLVGTMVVGTLLKPDLADREHLLAIAAGGVAAIVVRAVQGARAVPLRLRPVPDCAEHVPAPGVTRVHR